MHLLDIDFDKYGIGMERKKVVLLSHNKLWKKCFAEVRRIIIREIGLRGLRLYHIGSTSIPNIHAKPIIDVLGVVDSLREVDKKQKDFEKIGFEYKGEYGIKSRRYCVLYNKKKTIGYVHLHIFPKGHPEVKQHLVFKRSLLTNKKAAVAYNKLKLRFGEKYKNKRDKYTSSKNDFIQKIVFRTGNKKP